MATTASDLWVIDRDGRTFVLNLQDNSWRHISTPRLRSRNCFKRVAAAERCAWAINASQQPCLYVRSSDLPCRVKVETFENQRWAPLKGWSEKSMFPTDRWAWSSQDGKRKLPQDSFQLPSENWVWEEPWAIDRGLPGDIEGWQYAIDFPRTYHAEKFQAAFVRRRRWMRYYRFDGYDCWLQIPGICSDPVKHPFQDIAVGGTAIPGREPGCLSVWAVTFTCKIVYREGVTEMCPEGTEWVEVPCPPQNVTQLSISQTGVVWAVTWAEVAYVRVGVTYYQPMGTAWVEVNSPVQSPGAEPSALFQISAGNHSVWALTKDYQVWFRKGTTCASLHQTETDVAGTGWVQMVGEFYLLSVGPNDQVFALSTHGDHIYFRTDITPDELCGRGWKAVRTTWPESAIIAEGQLMESRRDSTVDSQSAESSLPSQIEFLIWIDSGACQIDGSFFSDSRRGLFSSVSSTSLQNVGYRDAQWRNTVLKLLIERDRQVASGFDAFEEAVSQGTWFKKGRFQLLTDKDCNLWSECVAKLDQGSEDREGAMLCYFEKNSCYEEMRIPLTDIKCVCIVRRMSRHNCFAIHTPDRTSERNPFVLACADEKDLTDWVTALATVVSRVHNSIGAAAQKAFWATSLSGDVFVCEAPSYEGLLHPNPNHLFWRQIGGHMRQVEAGAGGVVWGIGFDGVPYAYTGGYGGGIFSGFSSSAHGICSQEDYDVQYIYENQRWNPIQGFSDRRLPSDRWNWSDASGVYERTREGFNLPSSQWQWAGQWTVETNPELTDLDGWRYAIDFPRQYHRDKGWNDYVRRRRWHRRCKLTTTGPWAYVTPSVKLKDCSIQIDSVDSVDTCLGVWAVDSKGNVLFRHGVTPRCPQGTSWEFISTDVPFVSISIGCKRRIWGIAENGTAYFRAGFSREKATGDRWFHISERPPNLVQVSAGASSVWARDREGVCWYRESITDSYPEGTAWKALQGQVTHLSAGPKDQLWVCHNNAVEERYGITAENTQGIGWLVALSECWWKVCVRADSPDDVDEGEEVVQDELEPKSVSLQYNLDLSDVDIYTKYAPESPEASTDDSDEDGSQEWR